MATVVLRYFDIVGRAQPLRHALADAGVAFEDVRVTPQSWRQHRDDVGFGGPFRALPTLTWDDATIAETLPIGSFLGRRLGHNAGLDDAAIAAHDAVCSSAYLEVLVPLGELFWTELLHPGADHARSFTFRVTRMSAKLSLLEAHWTSGDALVVADFFAAEAYEAMRHAIGPARDRELATRLPRLAALAARVRARPAIAAMHRPARFTSHPDENTLVERFRALDVPL